MDHDGDVLDLLVAEPAASGRNRRGWVIAGAVAAVVLIGAALLVADGRGDDPQVAKAGTPELSVDLVSGMPQGASGLFGQVNSAAAIWNSDEKTLVYLSGFEWSSSCPPEGSAELTDAGILVLELDDYVGGGACTADAGRITATVRGLTDAPADLIVKTGAAATEVPIGADSFDAAAFVLDCESNQRASSIFDHFGTGPGEPTPLEAVAGLLDEGETAVVGLESPDAESVSLAVLRADGSTRSLVTLDRVRGGGWVVGQSDSCVE